MKSQFLQQDASFKIYKISSSEEMEKSLSVRKKVFVEEQNIEESDEFDGLDHESEHYLISLKDQIAGTARVRYLDNQAKIERVAILKDFRGKGLGQALIMFIIKAIRETSDVSTIKLGAQTHALPFYERLGFLPYGDEYLEAGIPHIDMIFTINRMK